MLGIASNSNTSIPTNGSVGGNGGAPPQPKGAAPGSVVPNYNFSSLGGYPTTPDSALSQDGTTALAEGTIKQTAINNGTYFNSQAAFTTWLGTQPSPLPGGNVLYLDFTPGNGTFNLGPGNINSSIMIIHTSTDSGIVQEVHGAFTGLIIADGFVRNNGVGQITGQVQLLSPTSSTAGNVFGNGNAEIDYSSAALANLPGLGGSTSSLTPAPATLSSYRRINY